jgi:hypothetical protein
MFAMFACGTSPPDVSCHNQSSSNFIYDPEAGDKLVFVTIATLPLLQVDTQTTKRIEFVSIGPSIKPCATAGAPLVVEEKAKDGSRGPD